MLQRSGLFLHQIRGRLVEPQRDCHRDRDEEVQKQDDERRERCASQYDEQRSQQVGSNERHQLLHLEADEVEQVVVDVTAILHRLDDGGEVVVGQDHHRRALGDFGAGDAHGHADVGFLQRRGIVDAIAGHGHDVLLLLEQRHQPDLVLRRHTGHHADLVQLLLQLLVRNGGKLSPCQGLCPRCPAHARWRQRSPHGRR